MLHAVVGELNEPHRTVFRLCGFDGWTPAEVAPLIGRSPKAVAHMRDRSRKDVMREVADRMGTGG